MMDPDRYFPISPAFDPYELRQTSSRVPSLVIVREELLGGCLLYRPPCFVRSPSKMKASRVSAGCRVTADEQEENQT